MDNQEAADLLNKLQAEENDGRGITCVRNIIAYLRQDDYDGALAVRQYEGDKTRSYPKVEKVLTEFFGCRAHGSLMCSSWICEEKVRK